MTNPSFKGICSFLNKIYSKSAVSDSDKFSFAFLNAALKLSLFAMEGARSIILLSASWFLMFIGEWNGPNNARNDSL